MTSSARRRLLLGVIVALAAVLIGAADSWAYRHFGARAAEDSATDDYLNAVACPTASECWAVGQTASDQGGDTLAEHRDQLLEQETGGHWRIVKAPKARESDPTLQAITCPAATDCWAVGGSGAGGTAIIEHWTGGAWQLTVSPALTGAALDSVSCVSVSLCWATGGAQSPYGSTWSVLEVWDGSRWTAGYGLAGIPEPRHLACPQAGSCLLVGWHGNVLAAAAYTGGGWQPAAPPGGPAGRDPAFVACASRRDCLAVFLRPRSATSVWNGRRWRSAAASLPPGWTGLTGLSCSGRSGCWLVGSGSGQQPLALHWQGSRWAAVGVGTGRLPAFVNGVACAAVCWAVGGTHYDRADGTSSSYPFIAPVAGS